MAWPVFTVPDVALFDRGCWRLTIRLQNAQALPIHSGTIQVKIVACDAIAASPLPRIEPGQHSSLDISIPGENIPEGALLPIEVAIRQRSPRTGTESQRVERYQVPRSKQLMERTIEQADFENMF